MLFEFMGQVVRSKQYRQQFNVRGRLLFQNYNSVTVPLIHPETHFPSSALSVGHKTFSLDFSSAFNKTQPHMFIDSLSAYLDLPDQFLF